MFTAIRYPSGKTELKKLKASTTIAKGDALDFDGVYLVRATSSTIKVKYVALEAKVSGAAETPEVLVLKTDGVEFEGDTTGDPSSYVNTYCDLTDHDTLNEDASTKDTFLITKMEGVAADKKVIGYFQQ